MIPVLFTDQSTGPWTINGWNWDFGDNLGNSAQSDPSYLYPGSGTFPVSLEVTDIFGCKDTIVYPAAVEVLEDVVPTAPPINYIGVRTPNRIRISFEPYVNPRRDFGEYLLYRQDPAGVWQFIQSTDDISQTTFIDQAVNTEQNSYCYKLVVSNHCGTESELAASTTHCTILLETTPLPDAIGLSWSPYVGWGSGLDRYDIYRVVNYDMNTASFLASVPASQTQYMDEDMFCYDAVTYRILAWESGTQFNSHSNISGEAPVHLPPSESLHMLNATVEGDAFCAPELGGFAPGTRCIGGNHRKERWDRICRMVPSTSGRSHLRTG